MQINAEWHRAHPMAKNPTLDQRLAWHVAHAKACSCREMPEIIRREAVSRGLLEDAPSPDEAAKD